MNVRSMNYISIRKHGLVLPHRVSDHYTHLGGSYRGTLYLVSFTENSLKAFMINVALESEQI